MLAGHEKKRKSVNRLQKPAHTSTRITGPGFTENSGKQPVLPAQNSPASASYPYKHDEYSNAIYGKSVKSPKNLLLKHAPQSGRGISSVNAAQDSLAGQSSPQQPPIHMQSTINVMLPMMLLSSHPGRSHSTDICTGHMKTPGHCSDQIHLSPQSHFAASSLASLISFPLYALLLCITAARLCVCTRDQVLTLGTLSHSAPQNHTMSLDHTLHGLSWPPPSVACPGRG